MRFQRGIWETAEWYGSGKKTKKRKKNQKIKKFKKKSKKFKKIQKNSKKFKKIQKNYKKTWRPNIRVFACEPGSVLGYLITLLCTALMNNTNLSRVGSNHES